MTERELGELSARMIAVERDLKKLSSDVREIRDALLTVRGGKRALVFLLGVSASAGGAVAAIIPALFK